MRITVTGSLGSIGKPLTELLVSREHEVTVLTSSEGRAGEIRALGASPTVGSVEDVESLIRAFTGADAVYTMIPPAAGGFAGGFDAPTLDPFSRSEMVADNYATALARAGVKRVLHLSSIGAHLSEGNGPIKLHHIAEQRLRRLGGVDFTFIRPGGFYYTLLNHIPAIKQRGAIAANYGGGDIVLLVASEDVAQAIADEFDEAPAGEKVRYVASEERTCSEVASILGAAIGKPDLEWRTITDQQMLAGAVSSGMKPDLAAGYVEMFSSIHKGVLQADYLRHRPVLGATKLDSFLGEFVAAYNK